MDAIGLVALILGSGFAILGGQTAKWRLMNLAIILACMVAGFGIGHAAGLGSKNLGQVHHADVPLSMMFGIIAAFGCIQLNNRGVK
jgi:NhaP-type Na+/H+ or K+/H+ antiporter